MPYRVVVDREKCIACGVAPSLCPEVFVLGSDNSKNRVVEKYSINTTETISIGIIPDELHDCAKEAAEGCPASAISIEEVSE